MQQKCTSRYNRHDIHNVQARVTLWTSARSTIWCVIWRHQRIPGGHWHWRRSVLLFPWSSLRSRSLMRHVVESTGARNPARLATADRLVRARGAAARSRKADIRMTATMLRCALAIPKRGSRGFAALTAYAVAAAPVATKAMRASLGPSLLMSNVASTTLVRLKSRRTRNLRCAPVQQRLGTPVANLLNATTVNASRLRRGATGAILAESHAQ